MKTYYFYDKNNILIKKVNQRTDKHAIMLIDKKDFQKTNHIITEYGDLIYYNNFDIIDKKIVYNISYKHNIYKNEN